jgi:hypothetical protein
MKMAMTITSRQFRRGEVIEDVSASGVALDDCWTEQGPADGERPTVERVKVSGLTLSRSSVIGAILRDVTIDGLRSDSFSVFLHANEFEHVTFRGQIPTLVIGARHSNPTWGESFRDALIAAESRVDWTIDISDAMGAVEVRGYSADRLRLNPERHGVVRRATLADRGWTDGDIAASGFAVDLRLMLEGGWDDAVLVADPLSKRYDRALAALNRLKDDGIAS